MGNMLPLETFRQAIGYHPWHWWQLANDTVPVTSQCNTLVREWAWQGADMAGRHEIREAIATAEQRLTELLGYAPAPHYTSETIRWPLHYDPRLTAHSGALLQLSEGEIRALGTESLTLIGSTSPIYEDRDGDSLDESWSATIVTTVTDAAQIAVYFADGDRLDGESAGDRWRIAPVTVTIGSGVATIRGRRWQLVKPALYEGTTEALNPTTGSTFVATLEVYQRTTDGDSQATLYWDAAPYPAWCVDGGTDPAAVASASARVGLYDSRVGVVAAVQAVEADGVWSAALCSDWCRPPDRVTVNYLAGVPLEGGQMAAQWRPVVVRLAAAELAQRICACETAARELHRWQLDLARTGGNNDEQYGAISAEDLANPLGTRRGQIYAWKVIRSQRTARGFLVG